MPEDRQKYIPLPAHVAQIVDDYSQIVPRQGGSGIIPPGTYPAVITDTEILLTKNNEGWMIDVTFDTPAGSIIRHYNRGHPKPEVVNRAMGELSALAHATGEFGARPADHYAAWRGKRCQVVIEPQRNVADADKDKGYTECRKVLDVNGNEPGKPPKAASEAAPVAGSGGAWPTAGAAQTAPVQTAPPPPNAGWNTNGGAAQTAPNTAPAGWGAQK